MTPSVPVTSVRREQPPVLDMNPLASGEAMALLEEGKIETAKGLLETFYSDGLKRLGDGNKEAGYDKIAKAQLEADAATAKGEDPSTILKDIPPELVATDKILRKFGEDKLKLANLDALSIWEAFAEEDHAVRLNEAKGLIGQASLALDTFLGKETNLDELAKHTGREQRLIQEVRKQITAGPAQTIKDALLVIRDSGPEDLKSRAGELLADVKKRGEDEKLFVAQIIGFASEVPPKPEHTDWILRMTQDHQARDLWMLAPAAVYSWVYRNGDEASRAQAETLYHRLNGEKGIADYASALIQSTTVGELAAEILLMHGAVTLGRLTKLHALAKLGEKGVSGKKAITLAMGAETAVEGSALWALNTGYTSLNNDLSKVMDPEALAKSYGASLIMIGGLKSFLRAGQHYGPKVARHFDLVTPDRARLSAGGRALAWGTNHASGLSGMVATTHLNQALGLASMPEGGFAESTVHDVYSYLKYGVANRGADLALQGKLSAGSRKAHTQIAVLESQRMAEAHMKDLGYLPVGREGSIPIYEPREGSPMPQMLFNQLTFAPLARPGFDSGPFVSLAKEKSPGAAENYAGAFGLRPVFLEEGFLNYIQGLSHHEAMGTKPPRDPDLIQRIRQGWREFHINFGLMMLGGMVGEGSPYRLTFGLTHLIRSQKITAYEVLDPSAQHHQKTIKLTDARKIWGLEFPQGTLLSENASDELIVRMPKKGRLRVGSDEITGPNRYIFSLDGKLKAVELAELGADHAGDLLGFEFARPEFDNYQSIQGILFYRGDKIYFNEDGKVEKAWLSVNKRFDGVLYPQGTTVLFDQNGKVSGISREAPEETPVAAKNDSFSPYETAPKEPSVAELMERLGEGHLAATYAAEKLAGMGKAEGFTYLRTIVQEPDLKRRLDANIRWVAALFLPLRASPPSERIYLDRLYAAHALGRLGAKEDIDLFRAWLKDKDPERRALATAALKAHGAKNE